MAVAAEGRGICEGAGRRGREIYGAGQAGAVGDGRNRVSGSLQREADRLAGYARAPEGVDQGGREREGGIGDNGNCAQAYAGGPGAYGQGGAGGLGGIVSVARELDGVAVDPGGADRSERPGGSEAGAIGVRGQGGALEVIGKLLRGDRRAVVEESRAEENGIPDILGRRHRRKRGRPPVDGDRPGGAGEGIGLVAREVGEPTESACAAAGGEGGRGHAPAGNGIRGHGVRGRGGAEGQPYRLAVHRRVGDAVAEFGGGGEGGTPDSRLRESGQVHRPLRHGYGGGASFRQVERIAGEFRVIAVGAGDAGAGIHRIGPAGDPPGGARSRGLEHAVIIKGYRLAAYIFAGHAVLQVGHGLHGVEGEDELGISRNNGRALVHGDGAGVVIRQVDAVLVERSVEFVGAGGEAGLVSDGGYAQGVRDRRLRGAQEAEGYGLAGESRRRESRVFQLGYGRKAGTEQGAGVGRGQRDRAAVDGDGGRGVREGVAGVAGEVIITG